MRGGSFRTAHARVLCSSLFLSLAYTHTRTNWIFPAIHLSIYPPPPSSCPPPLPLYLPSCLARRTLEQSAAKRRYLGKSAAAADQHCQPEGSAKSCISVCKYICKYIHTHTHTHNLSLSLSLSFFLSRSLSRALSLSLSLSLFLFLCVCLSLSLSLSRSLSLSLSLSLFLPVSLSFPFFSLSNAHTHAAHAHTHTHRPKIPTKRPSKSNLTKRRQRVVPHALHLLPHNPPIPL